MVQTHEEAIAAGVKNFEKSDLGRTVERYKRRNHIGNEFWDFPEHLAQKIAGIVVTFPEILTDCRAIVKDCYANTPPEQFAHVDEPHRQAIHKIADYLSKSKLEQRCEATYQPLMQLLLELVEWPRVADQVRQQIFRAMGW